jgi:hypothetical protein
VGFIALVLICSYVYTRTAYVAMRKAELALAVEKERRGAIAGAPAPPPGRPPAWSLEAWRRDGKAETDSWEVSNPLREKGRGKRSSSEKQPN